VPILFLVFSFFNAGYNRLSGLVPPCWSQPLSPWPYCTVTVDRPRGQGQIAHRSGSRVRTL